MQEIHICLNCKCLINNEIHVMSGVNLAIQTMDLMMLLFSGNYTPFLLYSLLGKCHESLGL